MIARDNFYEPHIRDLQAQSKGDPGLIERALYAFGLLEALAKVGLNFIFKGGTSLLLLLPEPKRLSTDIDIVVAPGTDIESSIEEASKIFPFQKLEEQKRVGRNNIVKRHFKFTYDSPIRKRPLYILLDVLFEENHYKKLIQKEIKNDLLLTEGENLKVTLPSIDCILGDKLTAFAPHTTGIPLGADKDLEVIKQFYDVGTLIDAYTDFDDLRQTYFDVSKAELAFRGNPATSEEAHLDTMYAAACIGSRGKFGADDFPSYLRGSRDIAGHIFENPRYNMEIASLSAPKVIYMAASLLTGQPFQKDIDIDSFKDENLTQPELMVMSSFRKRRSNAYGHLVLADRLLREYRNQ